MGWPPSATELVERNIRQRDCAHEFRFVGYTHLGTGTFAEYACQCGRTRSLKLQPFGLTIGPVRQKRDVVRTAQRLETPTPPDL